MRITFSYLTGKFLLFSFVCRNRGPTKYQEYEVYLINSHLCIVVSHNGTINFLNIKLSGFYLGIEMVNSKYVSEVRTPNFLYHTQNKIN